MSDVRILGYVYTPHTTTRGKMGLLTFRDDYGTMNLEPGAGLSLAHILKQRQF